MSGPRQRGVNEASEILTETGDKSIYRLFETVTLPVEIIGEAGMATWGRLFLQSEYMRMSNKRKPISGNIRRRPNKVRGTSLRTSVGNRTGAT